MMSLRARSESVPLPTVSPVFLKVFRAYARSYVGRHFHAVRLLRSAPPPRGCNGPLVIFLNHAAWWDPLVCMLLAAEFLADRTSFAPIDSAMLERYGFFRRLGLFGIEPMSVRGARIFLRTAHRILASPTQALWLTPQARFADVRERPPRLANGLGALAARELHATFIPLAVEYSFWTEPHPEVLIAFGEPIQPRGCPDSTAGWTRTFASALEAVQDTLAAGACRRDPADWITLKRGRTGISSIYDVWHRLRARWRGENYVPEHSPQETS